MRVYLGEIVVIPGCLPHRFSVEVLADHVVLLRELGKSDEVIDAADDGDNTKCIVPGLTEAGSQVVPHVGNGHEGVDGAEQHEDAEQQGVTATVAGLGGIECREDGGDEVRSHGQEEDAGVTKCDGQRVEQEDAEGIADEAAGPGLSCGHQFSAGVDAEDLIALFLILDR